MGKVINVKIESKIATAEKDAVYVCDNSDYEIHFAFDDEWAEFSAKTAMFVYNGKSIPVVFEGNVCSVPIIENTLAIEVGVFAGNLHTTTPAFISARRSILSKGGTPADPPDDVYNQIMERLNNLEGVNPATTEKLGVIKVGNNLEITEDGVLSVTTTNEAEKDNTKPITSAGVYTQVGNIEILLAAL